MSAGETPRPEHPRPQLVRPDWLCLNGWWEFEVDARDAGLKRGLVERPLRERILVPFCPESSLSGVGRTEVMPAVWYRRSVAVPEAWRGRRVLLRFQAVDYDTTVWVDGVEVGRHRGGFTPFACDVTAAVEPGREATIVVRARDDVRPPQPRGKQTQAPEPYSVFYTRTTGIWQTVWLEAVPDASLGRPRFTPELAAGVLRLEQPVAGAGPGWAVRAVLGDGAGEVATSTAELDSTFAARLDLPVPPGRRRPWSPSDPHLYGVRVELLDPSGRPVDAAASYAGLRSVALDGPAVLLNGEPVFQRLVLDQGYYPDGVMTAPTDAALRRDIDLAMAAGFNGARLHQKVFEERFLYHADRLGYLVWGEFGDWGCIVDGPEEERQRPTAAYVAQWLEALERDYSHPSVVGWCPLNETAQPLHDRITELDDVTLAMYLATKAADRTRPVLDASGYAHRVPGADVYDSHDYEQDPDRFHAHHAGTAAGQPFANRFGDRPMSVPYAGQPYFVSEFGGIRWSPGVEAGDSSWGYGDGPRTVDEFHRRFEELCGALLDDASMFGYCYTQLTDVHQEHNGIYTFAREPKFDLAPLRRAQCRPAAVESAAARRR